MPPQKDFDKKEKHKPFSEEDLMEHLLSLIIKMDLPFSIVEAPSFKKFVTYLGLDGTSKVVNKSTCFSRNLVLVGLVSYLE